MVSNGCGVRGCIVQITHKRPRGSKITKLHHVLALMVLVESTAKNMLKFDEYEDHFATIHWIAEDAYKSCGLLADTSPRAVWHSAMADKLVEKIRNGEKCEKAIDNGGLWLLSVLNMILDDIDTALRDPVKKKIIAPLVGAALDLQRKFDNGRDVSFLDEANVFMDEIYLIVEG